MNRPEQTIAICIGCGCDDDHACDDGPGPCYWLKVDRQRGVGVCSSCPGFLPPWNAAGGQRLSQQAVKAVSLRIQAEGAAEHRRRHASRQQ